MHHNINILLYFIFAIWAKSRIFHVAKINMRENFKVASQMVFASMTVIATSDVLC